jgi:type IV pilus assembly protein PilY1
MNNRKFSTILALSLVTALPVAAWAQVTVGDDFTLASDSNDWLTFNGACLTAGDGTGKIPACVGLPYYKGQTLVGGTTGTLPDKAGNGALRFTNGFTSGGSGFQYGFNQAGGIISNFTFNAGSGIQVIFKTVTYRGNSGGNGGSGTIDAKDGADGISFFLIDGATSPFDTGAFGGSLGYSCSNSNNDSSLHSDGSPRQYDGLMGGYLGLGIDEFGNFLNASDNTASGYGLQAGRIGLRGKGSIAWKALNTAQPTYYPSTLTAGQRAEAVQNTCKTGTIWDYSKSTASTTKKTQLSTTIPDYAVIPNAYKVLSSGFQIANEKALTRDQTQPLATRAIPIAYKLKITQDGLLTFAYSYNGGSYQPVITGQSITGNNGSLPAVLRFGFAGSTGGSTNVHEILCFQAAPADLASTSVGVNEKEAAKIADGTQAYLAMYFPNDWTGRLTANDLTYDPTTQTVGVATKANWDASCNLTGAKAPTGCATTGASSVTAQGSSNRVILSWNGTNGIPFQYASLTSAQKTTITAGDVTANTANRVNYLRGDTTNEINSSGVGLYRARNSVLGDIIDSSPTWVGPPNNPYTTVWADRLYTSAAALENGTNNYTSFISTSGTRLNVVYGGSNDGLLHGFRSGAFDSSGKYVNNSTYPNDGYEVLAYMPGAVVNTIHNTTDATLDYSNSQYGHNFFVDGTPATDDLFYKNAWHTWLVGGLGAGGSALYALDVTNPANFSEGKAATVVIGEWNATNLSCANNGGCNSNLGNTYGVPVIRRLHDGNWGVIFGNGYGSSSGDAGIYVMVVNATTGVKTFYYLGTGTKGNGIASPAPADLDGDHITDYVYAGDLLGNVWRFDLTSTDEAKWVAQKPILVFNDPSAHPITTKLGIAVTPMSTGAPRLMIDFGTGQRIPLTNASPATYDAGAHAIYGIWDANMTSWNALSKATYASLPTPDAITLSNLQVQVLTPKADGNMDATSNPICWADLTTCASTKQYGFYMLLPGTAEQIIFNPLVFQGALIVNTTIPVPTADSATSCKSPVETGYTLALSLSTGAPIPGLFPNYHDTAAVGSLTNGTGTPFVVYAGTQAVLLTQTTGLGTKTGALKCDAGSQVCSGTMKPPAASGKRLTWIERR